MRRHLPAVGLLTLLAGGCFNAFNVRDYSTSADLYRAGMERYRRGKYADAATAFERLTLDLPTRDSLLPLAHWYLGNARLRRDERLLAAQAFIRLAETLPDDSLADDALLASGRAYRGLWKRPSLDPQYGLLAQTQFRLMIAAYPTSAYTDTAAAELTALDEWFAKKDYETGLYYRRRRAYDSAILFFKDVVKNHPETATAREAMLRMVEIYRLPVLNYREDAAEVCEALRATYPTHPSVLATCKVDPADSAAAPAARRP